MRVKSINLDGIRTRNPQIRSLMRYPIAPRGQLTTAVRFELTRVEPNRFRIYRLNHSAMLPPHDCKQASKQASKQQQQKQKITWCSYNYCSSGGQVGIEPTTSRTQIENHTTRPLTQLTYAFLAERSKALRSGRSIFGCVGSNPTECIDTLCYNHYQFW